MKKRFYLFGCLLSLTLAATANPVVVKLNTVTTTMSLAEKESGREVALPAPVNREYSLELDPGDYILTGYGTDGTTVNGKIVMNVTDSTTVQQKTLITCTAYVTNKDDDSNPWTVEKGDYTFTVKVNTREGAAIETVPGNSITKNRYTFLAFNGNSYYAEFEPSETHKAEGFMTLYRGGTLTANVNVYGAIPPGGAFSVTVPTDAVLHLGMKFTHFTDFTPVTPDSVEETSDGKTYCYTLANGQVYNYRTWTPGGLTHGGYFTMNVTDPSKCPRIAFNTEDYAKHDPKAVNHSVKCNNGYETGDILLNINPRGHLLLQPGEEFDVHAMRMWELTDNSTNNYFFEPDFHYTVLDTDFRPSADVIEIENADTNDSAWSKIKAKSVGTAIVLVTYDGINLNFYNNADKKEYLGGEYWGAIWPENTGVFIVTVGQGESAVKPNMVVNQQYNVDALRLAGENVDAEHDVFYYLAGEEGFPFSFKPEGIASISIATPTIGETAVEYSGFSTDGITLDDEGTYTVMLREGRNIIKMTDPSGNSVYQVISAKPCRREIVNLTREGSQRYQPGDKVKIQYSGLFHPANKIAGIYNMSAYVTYNGVPNGSSLILGSGQYTFGSAASAQAVTVEIPEDYDAVAKPQLVMDEGVIQVNGYGDPIGNHRNTSPLAGRSPNFTAVPHKTYFGAIPEIRIPISPMQLFDITLGGELDGADITVSFGEKTLEADADGKYTGTFGTYSVVAKKTGYRCFRANYTIAEDAEGPQTFDVALVEGTDGMWDGSTVSPVEADSEGVYHITTGDELAYLAAAVAENGKNLTAPIVLDNDIDLGDYDWTPIGASSSKPFSGKFNGNGHKVTGLYLDRPKDNLTALFGYVTGTADSPAQISNLTVEGHVCGKQYVGGIVANLNANASIDRCANLADVTATSYAGGVVGYISSATGAKVTNCYNHGDITGTANVGGVAGYNNASAILANIYSVGKIDGGTANSVGAVVGSTTSKANVSGAYAIEEYTVTDGQEKVSVERMASGEIAYRLGEAFTQTIGLHPYPVFDGAVVSYDEENDEYYNESTGIPASDLTLDIREVSLDLNENFTVVLNVTYAPVYADAPEVTWSSGDERIVYVEKDGELSARITAMADGETIVKVEKADNPDVSDSCAVKVGGETTTVEEIIGESGVAPVDIYDLNGRAVRLGVAAAELQTMAPGVYIVRTAGSVKAVIVK